MPLRFWSLLYWPGWSLVVAVIGWMAALVQFFWERHHKKVREARASVVKRQLEAVRNQLVRIRRDLKEAINEKRVSENDVQLLRSTSHTLEGVEGHIAALLDEEQPVPMVPKLSP